MDATEIVVGSKDCPILEVYKLINNDVIIMDRWSHLARILDIDTHTIEKMRNDMIVDKINFSDIVHGILEGWVAFNGRNATLVRLLHAVEDELENNLVGEKLRLRFNLPCKSAVGNPSVSWDELSFSFKARVEENFQRFFPNVEFREALPKLTGTMLIDLMTGKMPSNFSIQGGDSDPIADNEVPSTTSSNVNQQSVPAPRVDVSGSFGVTPTGIDNVDEDAARPSTSASANRATGNSSRIEIPSSGSTDDEEEEKPKQLKGTTIFYYQSKELGNGATGTVYEGYHNSRDRPAAIKRVRSAAADMAATEIRTWRDLGPNDTGDDKSYIVKLFDYTDWLKEGKKSYLYFAMELATTDLADEVDKLKTLPKDGIRPRLFGYLENAARGLRYLHEKVGIIHRDIKPTNILIFDNGMAKLGDFGISRKITNVNTGTDSRGIGASDWMAPEAIQALHLGQNFRNTKGLDIFSFGMTAYYTLSLGIHPFHDSIAHGKSRTENIKDMNIQPSSLGVEEHTADHLFQWMMLKDPKRRPNISQVLNHPFFWATERSLKFLVEVANTFSIKKDDNAIAFRKDLYDLFRYLYAVYVSNAKGRRPPTPNGVSCFDWTKDLGKDVMDLLTGHHKKKYNGKSVMSLVELIRDKCEHAVELKKELLQDRYFGKDGIYSDYKFGRFFLKKFPYLVIFLYTILSKPLTDYSFINPLKLKFELMDQADIPSLPPLKPFFEDKMFK